jgi:hypothetical protein
MKTCAALPAVQNGMHDGNQNDEDLVQLPREVAERIVAALVQVEKFMAWQEVERRAILSSREAMRMAGFKSSSAFYRWTNQWRVLAAAKGRWPSHRVKAGLHREAISGGKSRARIPKG